MKSWAAAFIVVFAWAAPVAAGGPLYPLFDMTGFDYEDPDPDPSMIGEVSSGYSGVGFVAEPVFPFVIDATMNQYTYRFSGLTSTRREVFGNLFAVLYTGGTLTVYEDPIGSGTPAAFGIDPPNGTAPSTFSDGTPFLILALSEAVLAFNADTNSGSYLADYQAVGGSGLTLLPPDARWGQAGGLLDWYSTPIPSGYAHWFYGDVRYGGGLPVERSTWGRIKAAYR